MIISTKPLGAKGRSFGKTFLAWNLQVCVKPADSCYPSMTLPTTLLVMSHDALLSQSFWAPMRVQRGWGQVTGEESQRRSGILGFLWSSSSFVNVLRHVWAHYPAVLSICVDQVSEEWSGTSPQSGVLSVEESKFRGSKTLEFFHHHDSLCGWAHTFYLLFVFMCAFISDLQKIQTWINQYIELLLSSTVKFWYFLSHSGIS